jgi:hypothetical protein
MVLREFTPRASRRVRLATAAFMWTAVGVGLLAAGLHWLAAAGSNVWLTAIPIAAAVGWAKGRFVLAPFAAANAARIKALDGARCLGGTFSWRSWLLAAAMMLGGATLRHSPLPRPWLGCIYTAVGTALLASGCDGWARWLAFVRSGPDLDGAGRIGKLGNGQSALLRDAKQRRPPVPRGCEGRTTPNVERRTLHARRACRVSRKLRE